VTVWTGRRLAGRAGVRAWAACAAVGAVNSLSRALGRGSGTVAGGRVGLALDPGLLATLAAGRRVVLVSGTNGKTTTTRLLVAALAGPDGASPVVSNETGANMPAGHVAALAGAPDVPTAVLEVDEGYLGRLIDDTRPDVVVLLNLSRDQLDRIAEVRMLADRWRAALGRLPAPRPGVPGTVVVANADDPMVAYAAGTAPEVRWVGAGQVWHDDAVGCPACGGRIAFPDDGRWACDRCDFARPGLDAEVVGDEVVLADGTRHPIRIALPGQFNRANAGMVAVAALPLLAEAAASGKVRGPDGGPPDVDLVLGRLAAVREVAGRFSTITREGGSARLLLAKNPAGWTAVFDLLDESADPTTPVVLSVNARTADGLDTSWLWDVPFERLAGRAVVATGDRRLDLAVRLRYAEVAHDVVDGPLAALDHALGRAAPGAGVEFLGNYTAFADLRRAR
jgi:lipid II isoglutaminyl synthase (glutamine-hydrolysing)